MGQALQLYLRPEVQVANYARNGRSTVSFRSEGLWQAAANALRPGDILLIQFGHNDEKLEDPARGAGPEQYAANLLAYASEAINAGALPVIVTPLTRRQFGPDGKLCDTRRLPRCRPGDGAAAGPALHRPDGRQPPAGANIG